MGNTIVLEYPVTEIKHSINRHCFHFPENVPKRTSVVDPGMSGLKWDRAGKKQVHTRTDSAFYRSERATIIYAAINYPNHLFL